MNLYIARETGSKKDCLGLYLHEPYQLIECPELHDPRLAVAHTGRLAAPFYPASTEVAQVAGHGDIVVTPIVLINPHRAGFHNLDPPFSNRQPMLLLAGQFTCMTSCAEFIVDEQTEHSHYIPSFARYTLQMLLL